MKHLCDLSVCRFGKNSNRELFFILILYKFEEIFYIFK